MTAAHYKGGHHPGNDLGLHYTALPPIVASCPYSDQLLVTPKFCSPGANRPSQVRPLHRHVGLSCSRVRCDFTKMTRVIPRFTAALGKNRLLRTRHIR